MLKPLRRCKLTRPLFRVLFQNKYYFLILGFSIFLHGSECLTTFLTYTWGTAVFQGTWSWMFLFAAVMLSGKRISRPLLTCLLILQMVFTVTSIFLRLEFAMGLSGDVFLVLAESSWQEASQFIISISCWQLYAGILFFFSLLVFLIRLLWKEPVRYSPLLYVILCIFMIPQLINTIHHITARGSCKAMLHANILTHNLCNILDASKETIMLKNMAVNPELPEGIRRIDHKDKFLAVLVLGESASRFHHSIYGYPRKTGPEMEKLGDGLIVYEDVIAGHELTTRSLRYLLTTEEVRKRNDFRYTLFDIFHAAGFRICFYSNQPRWSLCDSPFCLMTNHVDERIYMKGRDGFDIKCFDAAEKAIAELNAPTLIVLHLWGSHKNFRNRSPETHKIFTKHNRFQTEEIIDDWQEMDEYDNSLFYTDYLLGTLAEKLKSLQYPAFFLYLSDHGESPEEIIRNPRCGNTVIPACYEVPFMLYANPVYQKCYPDFLADASKNTKKPYQTDHAMYSVFSAARITFNGFPYEKDIFSAEFIPTDKRFLGDTAVEYKSRENPYLTQEK